MLLNSASALVVLVHTKFSWLCGLFQSMIQAATTNKVKF